MQKKASHNFKPHSIEWDDEKARRLWDYYGASEAHRGRYFGEAVGAHVVRVLRRNGLFRRTKTIVDFSCGTGALIASILRYRPGAATVKGFDLSALSVDKANVRNDGKPGFCGAYEISGYPTPLATESVDLLILTEVIEHLDDETLHQVLTDCHRVLSTNGRLVVTTPNEEELARSNVMCPECGCTFHSWQHQRSWTVRTLESSLRAKGFSKVVAKKITWGNELIELAFVFLRRKPTGILAIAEK